MNFPSSVFFNLRNPIPWISQSDPIQSYSYGKPNAINLQSLGGFIINYTHQGADLPKKGKLLPYVARKKGRTAAAASRKKRWREWRQWPFQEPKLEVPIIYIYNYIYIYIYNHIYIRTVSELCKGITPQNMAFYSSSSHFRVLKFPADQLVGNRLLKFPGSSFQTDINLTSGNPKKNRKLHVSSLVAMYPWKNLCHTYMMGPPR